MGLELNWIIGNPVYFRELVWENHTMWYQKTPHMISFDLSLSSLIPSSLTPISAIDPLQWIYFGGCIFQLWNFCLGPCHSFYFSTETFYFFLFVSSVHPYFLHHCYNHYFIAFVWWFQHLSNFRVGDADCLFPLRIYPTFLVLCTVLVAKLSD